jgi:hypothetical protein
MGDPSNGKPAGFGCGMIDAFSLIVTFSEDLRQAISGSGPPDRPSSAFEVLRCRSIGAVFEFRLGTSALARSVAILVK